MLESLGLVWLLEHSHRLCTELYQVWGFQIKNFTALVGGGGLYTNDCTQNLDGKIKIPTFRSVWGRTCSTANYPQASLPCYWLQPQTPFFKFNFIILLLLPYALHLVCSLVLSTLNMPVARFMSNSTPE